MVVHRLDYATECKLYRQACDRYRLGGDTGTRADYRIYREVPAIELRDRNNQCLATFEINTLGWLSVGKRVK
jgi:hypothetical protein